MPNIILGSGQLAGGYEVDNSLRFNGGETQYLTRTASSGSYGTTYTISFWFKQTKHNDAHEQYIYMGGDQDTANNLWIRLQGTARTLYLRSRTSSSNDCVLITNRVFRDPSAWYHIVYEIDTTQGTASNRVKLYINGVQETSFGTETYPDQNDTFKIATSSKNMDIGRRTDGSSYNNFGLMLAEFCIIDGTAYDQTSFGEFDSDTNIWKPKDVSGLTFGTNGFYLDFENASSLGADVSGNGNNFTVSNLTSTDQSTDTCTNNFATLNPLYGRGDFTFTEGNLQADDKSHASDDASTISTIGVTQGKWYLEVKIIDQGTRGYFGFTDGADLGLAEGSIRSSPANWAMHMPAFSNSTDTSGTENSEIGTGTDGDIICIAFDADNGQIWFKKNANVDTSTTAQATGITTGNTFHFFINETAANADVSGYNINFGSPSYSISSGNSDANGYGNFEYSVPSGYYALNSKNLAEYG